MSLVVYTIIDMCHAMTYSFESKEQLVDFLKTGMFKPISKETKDFIEGRLELTENEYVEVDDTVFISKSSLIPKAEPKETKVEPKETKETKRVRTSRNEDFEKSCLDALKLNPYNN